MHPEPRCPQLFAGYTLIELLVVIAIVATLSAVVTLTSGPNEAAHAEREARRLATLLELSMIEARASGRSTAWSPEEGGYAFWMTNGDGEWTRFPDDSAYRQRRLGAGASLVRVRLDGQELARGDRVILSPYGARGLIEATIAGGNARFKLQGGIAGRISVRRTPAEPDSDANPAKAERAGLYAG